MRFIEVRNGSVFTVSDKRAFLCKIVGALNVFYTSNTNSAEMPPNPKRTWASSRPKEALIRNLTSTVTLFLAF